MDLLMRILGMLIYRPYVFVFFLIYFFAAKRKLGRRQALVFSVISYLVAFSCEFLSTRVGFPFGLYHYIDVTRERELWIANVPFWDSLSFTFLCYLGWRLAVFLYAPLLVEEGDFQVVDTREVRGSVRVLVTGAILVALLDVVIDPVTLQGGRWFLGQIYFYPQGGIYFGVPLSNFAGWVFVAALAIGCFQRLDALAWMDPGRHSSGIGWVRWGGLIEPVLYLVIFLFNLAVTVVIGENLIAVIDVLIFLPVTVVFVSHPLNRQRWATAAELARHKEEFGVSAVFAQAAAQRRRRSGG